MAVIPGRNPATCSNDKTSNEEDMKTIETNYGNNWLDKLLNSWPFLLDTDEVYTSFAFAYCKKSGEIVRLTNLNTDMSTSLFQNGTVFVRWTVTPLTFVMLLAGMLLSWFGPWWLMPVSILLLTYGSFVHVSWKETGDRRYLQAGFGHKLNGRIGVLLRVPKNDDQAAKGTNGPNLGQAKGWECGQK